MTTNKVISSKYQVFGGIENWAMFDHNQCTVVNKRVCQSESARQDQNQSKEHSNWSLETNDERGERIGSKDACQDATKRKVWVRQNWTKHARVDHRESQHSSFDLTRSAGKEDGSARSALPNALIIRRSLCSDRSILYACLKSRSVMEIETT